MATIAAPSDGARLPADLHGLVRHCAALHRGLAFLHRGPVESVAVTLGVTPVAVERARALLDRPEERALAIEAFVRAASSPDPAPGSSAVTAGAPGAPPRAPAELIRSAERLPDGLDVLAGASLESAAIMFGVHPSLVAEARRALDPAHG